MFFFVHTACMSCLSRIRLVDNNQIHAFLHYWNMTTLRKKLRKNNSKRNVIKLRAAQNKFVKYRLHREIHLKKPDKTNKTIYVTCHSGCGTMSADIFRKIPSLWLLLATFLRLCNHFHQDFSDLLAIFHYV